MSRSEMLRQAGFKHYWFFWWAWDFNKAIDRLIHLAKNS